jgi:hypothetical protein
MNFCKDCQNFNEFNLCDGAWSELDMVTGKPFLCSQSPKEMRETEAYCGQNAVWFFERLKKEE